MKEKVEQTNQVLEENGMPQDLENLDSNDLESENEITNAETTNQDEEPQHSEKVLQSPDVEEGTRPVSRRVINYSCRTTCRQNVIIVTAMKDGSEDTITFVCNLKW